MIILLFILPFLFIFLTKWAVGGVSKLGKTLAWAFILIVFSYAIPFVITEMMEARGFCPKTPTDIVSAYLHSLLGAALPEELSKLIAVGLLVLIAKWKKAHLEPKHLVLYSCMVGCAFAWYEGILTVFILGKPVGVRCFAYFGHYFYSIMMGYGLYLYLRTRHDKPNSMVCLFWMIVLPIAAHTIYDAMIDCLKLTNNPIYFGGLVLCFLGSGYVAYRLIKQIRRTEQTNVVNAF